MNGRCYLRAVRPNREDRGRIAGVVVTFADITSLKRAQTALGESEARFRRMFTNNMVPMALCTKSGATVDANHAFLDLFGYTRTELEAGKIRWNEITPSGGRARDLEAIAELEVRGFCTPYEKVYTHKDGHPIPIFIGGGSFDEHAGTGVLFAVDLSRRKRDENALRDSEERVRTLVAASSAAGGG